MNTSNTGVRLKFGTDTAISSWHFSKKLATDTATYYVYSIGHDELNRFHPISTLYIDSLTFHPFVYNTSTDSLEEVYWKLSM
jgi:hypothetical protein